MLKDCVESYFLHGSIFCLYFEIQNRKSTLGFTFGQGSYLISDFARPNSNKAVLI